MLLLPSFRVKLHDTDDLLSKDLVVEVDLPLVAEDYSAVFESEEGVIFAYANILPWEYVRTALADEDLAYARRSTWGDLDP